MKIVSPVGPEMSVSGSVDRIPSRGFLSSLTDSPGDSTLSLAAGPLRCALDGLPEEAVERLRSRWRTLEGPSAGESPRAIRLTAVLAGVEQFLARPPMERRPEEYRFEYATEAGEHFCWSYRFALQFDPATGAGRLALCRTGSPYIEEAVENTLRVVFAWRAAQAGGILIHSAGVRRNGESYLFFGPSGAGKTTISTLCPPGDVLHDDLCVVFPSGGRYVAIGFPFLGDDRKHLTLHQEVNPVAGFYRLVQSPRVALERIRGARGAGEITGSLPFVTEQQDTGGTALRNVARMVETVPVFRLSFRKDASFWEEIERERTKRS